MLKRNTNLFIGKYYFNYRLTLNEVFRFTKIPLKTTIPRRAAEDESFASYAISLYKDEGHDISVTDMQLFLFSKDANQIGRWSVPVVRNSRKTYITLKNLTYSEFQHISQTCEDPDDLIVINRFVQLGGVEKLISNYYKSITTNNPISIEDIEKNKDLFMPLVFKNINIKFNDNETLIFKICKTSLQETSYWKIDETFITQCHSGRRRSALDIWLHALQYNKYITLKEVRDILIERSRSDKDASSICSTVRRRVFYNFGYGGGLGHATHRDEYGLTASQ